jgi:hypothetical protein
VSHYTQDDIPPARDKFWEQNAVVLLTERQAKIDRLRARIRQLEKSTKELCGEIARLQCRFTRGSVRGTGGSSRNTRDAKGVIMSFDNYPEIRVECDECGESELRETYMDSSGHIDFEKVESELEKEGWRILEKGRRHFCPNCNDDEDDDDVDEDEEDDYLDNDDDE